MMTLERSKWLLFIVPAVTIGTFETIRHTILENILPMELGNWTTAFIDAVVIALISRTIIHRLHQAEKEIHDQQRLQAINEERSRLATVLHDEIAQSLFYSGVRLHAAQQRLKLHAEATKLTVSLTTAEEPSSYWIFTIQDNGVGINNPSADTNTYLPVT